MRSNVSFRRGSMTFRTFYTRLSSEGKEGDFLMKDLGGKGGRNGGWRTEGAGYLSSLG